MGGLGNREHPSIAREIPGPPMKINQIGPPLLPLIDRSVQDARRGNHRVRSPIHYTATPNARAECAYQLGGIVRHCEVL